MPQTMRAVVFEAPEQVSIREMPYPAPGPNDVTIAVKACGLCGTDVHIYHGEFPAHYPLIPGHEFAGVIAEVGSEVENWHVGDRVTADPNIACGACYYCRNGQVNHCLNHQAIGVTRNGAWAEFVAVPARNVYPIAESLSFQEAAMVEPLSCVVYGLRRLQVQPGAQVLIFGAGPIGLLLMQGCTHGGASTVTVVDLEEKRLAAARSLGATHAVPADKGQRLALRGIAPYGFDAVIDATGVPAVVEQCLGHVKSGGKLLLFGVCPSQAKIPISPFDIYRRDLEIVGSFALRYTFDPALAWIENHVVQVKPLIRPMLTLDEVPAVLQNKRKRAADDMKAMIKL